MKITIIGAGNIGGAIARGLVRGGVFNASDITCTDLMQANLDRLLSADACFNVSQDNPTAIQGADLVVIAVKTWRVEAVIDEIRGTLDYERQSVVSVAAGIPFERLLRYFTKDAIGIPEDQLREAAKSAVCKINIDSDGRLAMTAAVREIFATKPAEFDPRKYLGPARDSLRELYKHKLTDVLGSANTVK